MERTILKKDQNDTVWSQTALKCFFQQFLKLVAASKNFIPLNMLFEKTDVSLPLGSKSFRCRLMILGSSGNYQAACCWSNIPRQKGSWEVPQMRQHVSPLVESNRLPDYASGDSSKVTDPAWWYFWLSITRRFLKPLVASGLGPSSMPQLCSPTLA